MDVVVVVFKKIPEANFSLWQNRRSGKRTSRQSARRIEEKLSRIAAGFFSQMPRQFAFRISCHVPEVSILPRREESGGRVPSLHSLRVQTPACS